MRGLRPKHPRAIRWLHWLSFPLLVLMCWSGLMIYWANPVYRLGAGTRTLFAFFPDRFYEVLSVDQSLAKGMAIHFFVGWLFTLNGLAYAAYLACSGEWRELLPARKSWGEALQVVRHDLGLSRELPSAGKYNAAQRIAYTAVVLMGAGSVVTGLAVYKPVQLSALARLLGGYERARLEHFWFMLGFAAFFVVHVVQVARAGWNNLRSMITGWELADAPTRPGAAPGPDAVRELRRMTRRGFVTGGAAAALGAAGWGWLMSRPEALGTPWPLRKNLEADGRLWGALFRCGHEAPVFPPVRGNAARLNGDIGLENEADPRGWKLRIAERGGRTRVIDLRDVAELPRIEATVDFACIEGWSQVMTFAGARFSDFMSRFGLGRARYVGLETPGREYYVSIDMDSMLHPQTLLVDEMNGKPLTAAHGAPLRLLIPVKYGIKHLKRIAAIRFSDQRPPDYWAERGYDWYAGL